ncbi:MAG: hypothetical protein E6J69_13630 [Deltaproteobacteria bacterium]|nr:MAG: hypothetical protein E6J69_13630 [Deltaproteobacteria bacterium]
MSRAADALSLARVGAAVALPLALARSIDRPGGAWLPLGLWSVGAATDLLDGPLARRLGGGTRHGALLDNAADVLFVLGAASTGAALGLLPSRVPVAIAVSFGAYALASAAGRAEAARAYTRIGHAAGVCNYLLAGLLAAVVARPGPGWGPVLDAAGLVVLGVNGAAAAVQAADAVRRARARPGAGR